MGRASGGVSPLVGLAVFGVWVLWCLVWRLAILLLCCWNRGLTPARSPTPGPGYFDPNSRQAGAGTPRTMLP